MNNFINTNFIEKVRLKSIELLIEEIKTNSTPSPIDVERVVLRAIRAALVELKTECEIYYEEGSHSFPDIICEFEDHSLGIEIKSSIRPLSADKRWVTLGNSILGSTSKLVDDLYLLYIKSNKLGIDAKVKRFEDVVSNIVVTHSPRFKIDMDLAPEKSFFVQSGISYSFLRSSNNPIEEITRYFRDRGETGWWISESTPALIRNWSEISPFEKRSIIAKGFVLFPELLNKNDHKKYKNVSKWLVAKYSIVDSNLRDSFTAGGKSTIRLNDESSYYLPQIYKQFLKVYDLFLNTIKTINIEELISIWQDYDIHNDSFQNRINYWLNKVKFYIKDTPNNNPELEFLYNLFFKVDRP